MEKGDRMDRIAVFADYGYVCKAPEFKRPDARRAFPLTDCQFCIHDKGNDLYLCKALNHMWCRVGDCSFYKRGEEKDGD